MLRLGGRSESGRGAEIGGRAADVKGRRETAPAPAETPESRGQLRPTISIFPAAVPGRPYADLERAACPLRRISGGTTPVFHRYYPEADLRPGFYIDAAARDLGRFGEIGGGVTSAGDVCPVESQMAMASASEPTLVEVVPVQRKRAAETPLPIVALRAAVPQASARRSDPDRFDEAEDEVSAA